MNLKRFLSVVFFSALAAVSSLEVSAQDRARVIQPEIQQTVYSRPTNLPQNLQPTPKIQKSTSRPVLTSPIYVIQQPQTSVAPLVKKTASSMPVKSAPVAAAGGVAAFNSRLTAAMDSKLGIPYRYGSNGPNTYDCSALVWTVFREAGIAFTRTSARNYWNEFEPVYGDERFQFGTLVFFNNLGHVGIVVNEKGFYHASSSKGVTYSSFEGYWANRIVGFRKIPMSMINPNLLQASANLK